MTRPRTESEEDFEERAAIMEFDGGLTREEAERRARAAQDEKRGRCPPEQPAPTQIIQGLSQVERS